jgi:hypothetical protein
MNELEKLKAEYETACVEYQKQVEIFNSYIKGWRTIKSDNADDTSQLSHWYCRAKAFLQKWESVQPEYVSFCPKVDSNGNETGNFSLELNGIPKPRKPEKLESFEFPLSVVQDMGADENDE